MEEKKGTQSVVNLKEVFSNFMNTMAKEPGIKVLQSGEKVSRYVVDAAKFNKGRKARIAILGGFIFTKVHFSNQTGKVICFEGACCDTLGYPKQRYVAPIAVYTTDDNGKVLSQEITIKVLSLWNEQYESLLSIADNMGDVTSYDLTVTCTDETYQKFSFAACKESLWQDSRMVNMQNHIKSEFERIGDKWLDPIARTMSEEAFLEKIGLGANLTDEEADTIERVAGKADGGQFKVGGSSDILGGLTEIEDNSLPF